MRGDRASPGQCLSVPCPEMSLLGGKAGPQLQAAAPAASGSAAAPQKGIPQGQPHAEAEGHFARPDATGEGHWFSRCSQSKLTPLAQKWANAELLLAAAELGYPGIAVEPRNWEGPCPHPAAPQKCSQEVHRVLWGKGELLGGEKRKQASPKSCKLWEWA